MPTLAYQQTVAASLHALPGQHGWLSPPHAWHVPALHVCPEGQAPPGQQGWLGPPHDWHAPATQVCPEPHAPPRQHGWLGPPQLVHFPDAQEKPAPQRLSAQHACPLAPQSEQVFAPVHTLPSAQRDPAAWHVFDAATVVSQQPVLQVSPAQQGWPSPPQPAHCPDPRQRSPFWQAEPEVRQICAVASQHPLSHRLPGQHGPPGVPHAAQTPRHTVFEAVHCV
jgi:hypothetical protein